MDKSINNIYDLDNYYNLFDITNSSSTNEIVIAYEIKIIQFNNIKNLSQNQINDIKILKTGLYILTNPELRVIYDKLLIKQSETMNQLLNNDKQSDTLDDLFNIDNSKRSVAFDELFNVDNSWMNNQTNQPNQEYSRKNKFESNVFGDRIFSLSEFNKKPNYSSEFESQLRKPQQGRIDKTAL
jgi:DnaJ-class molecular chaperone